MAAEYVLKASGLNPSSTGIGIAAEDLNRLNGINTVMNFVCARFKYVTLYTAETEEAGRIADMIYAKYGLPIMVLDISEAANCRYPVTMDFDGSKLRYGRDMCIIGFNEEGLVVRG